MQVNTLVYRLLDMRAVAKDPLRSWAGCCQIASDGETEVELEPVVQSLDKKTNSSTNVCNLYLPKGPKDPSPRTYATSTVAPGRGLCGEPFYMGSVLQLDQGRPMQEAELLLYASGFNLRPLDADSSAQPVTLFWSPFSYVEKFTVVALRNSRAAFTLIVPAAQERTWRFSFAPTGCRASETRDYWVEAMTTAINNVTLSLFPPHVIAVQPVLGVVGTYTRIMAGYLLQNRGSHELSLIYAELHAFSAEGARLSLYHDEWCSQELESVLLSDRACLSSYEADSCTMFGVNANLFSSRTVEEKIVWLRALANTKMKLLFGAPEPTCKDLGMFRAAVRERLEELAPYIDFGRSEPLLALVPRNPLASPKGDPDGYGDLDVEVVEVESEAGEGPSECGPGVYFV